MRRIRMWHSLNFCSVFVRKAEHDTANFYEIKLSSRRAVMFFQQELLHHTSSHSMAPSHSEYPLILLLLACLDDTFKQVLRYGHASRPFREHIPADSLIKDAVYVDISKY